MVADPLDWSCKLPASLMVLGTEPESPARPSSTIGLVWLVWFGFCHLQFQGTCAQCG